MHDGIWLILRAPGKVPRLKGPFPRANLVDTLREFIEARPEAFITVLSISETGPMVDDGPETLEILDGRSAPTARKHRASTRAAFAAATSQ